MMLFDIRYIADSGKVTRTRLDAPDQAQAVRALPVVPSAVLDVAPVPLAASTRIGRPQSNTFPLAQFCDELATLLEAGLVLHEALDALHERESHAEVSRVTGSLLADLREGKSFSDALRAQELIFGPFLIATVEASQRTGQVAITLRRHALHLQWRQQLRHKLTSAAVYPAMLSVAGAGVCLFLALVVVPRFAVLYEDLGGDVPLATRWLLAVSAGLTG
jgi:general secretion pathway protein F